MQLKEALDKLSFTYEQDKEDETSFKNIKHCSVKTETYQNCFDWKIKCNQCWLILERLAKLDDDVIVRELWIFIK